MFDWVLNMPLNFEKSYYTIGKSGRMQNEEVISLQNQIKKKKDARDTFTRNSVPKNLR